MRSAGSKPRATSACSGAFPPDREDGGRPRPLRHRAPRIRLHHAEGGGADIFVPARYTHGALPGDEVAVVVNEQGKFGKPEGRIERILKKDRAGLLGVYVERSGVPYLQPFDSPSVDDIPLKSRGKLRPAPGMIVEADRTTLALKRVFGRPDDPGVDVRVVAERYGLRTEFPEDVREETAGIPDLDAAAALEGRRDFRDWPTVTIDGEKAQDFDDAVSIRPLADGGWLLGVHIADVSHYVKPGSPLDREAAARGTSVYFPDATLPMLPERLSNGLCSLRPRVPRLTVSALLDIGKDGGRPQGRVHAVDHLHGPPDDLHLRVQDLRRGRGRAGPVRRRRPRPPRHARAGRGPAGAPHVRGQPRLRPPRARAHHRGRQAPGGRRGRAERGPPAHRGVHGRRQRGRGHGPHGQEVPRDLQGPSRAGPGGPREAPRHAPPLRLGAA